jgi:malate synthase
MPDTKALEAQVKAAQAEAAKLKAAADKRAADEKKIADKKKLDEGKAKELVAQLQADLEKANAEMEELRQRERERVDAAFDALPEASRAKLQPFRDDMSLGRFGELVAAEGASAVQSTDDQTEPAVVLPPPTGAVRPPPTSNNDSYTPTAEGAKRLDEMLVSDAALRKGKLVVETDPATGQKVRKFTMPIKTMLKNMMKPEAQAITLRRAIERDGG